MNEQYATVSLIDIWRPFRIDHGGEFDVYFDKVVTWSDFCDLTIKVILNNNKDPKEEGFQALQRVCQINLSSLHKDCFVQNYEDYPILRMMPFISDKLEGLHVKVLDANVYKIGWIESVIATPIIREDALE